MHLVCFSHLRWNFVYQRPQHLLSRFADVSSVWFWEEPIYGSKQPELQVTRVADGPDVCVPHLPEGTSPELAWAMQRELLDEQLSRQNVSDYVLWYYTPLAMNFTAHLKPRATVYDCMDELSAFRGAPPGLRVAERELFASADVVFTGGRSLFESKKRQHNNVHAFPSSIDAKHFERARETQPDPADQQHIPHPRVGFAGVIDERLDADLLLAAAELCPEWNFIMIGPVVKIKDSELPRRSNIHYLGQKRYEELPTYFAGWDLGMLPFARNEATRYISPTKTPEYLAAGLPVVSTSIADVVHSYGTIKLAEIADTPAEFASACKKVLDRKNDPTWLARVDKVLATNSWDLTWKQMHALIQGILEAKAARTSERKTALNPPWEVAPST